jgi:hypothetical protein
VIRAGSSPRGRPPREVGALGDVVRVLCAAGNSVLLDTDDYGFARGPYGWVCHLALPIDVEVVRRELPGLSHRGVRLDAERDLAAAPPAAQVYGGTWAESAHLAARPAPADPLVLDDDVVLVRGEERVTARLEVRREPERRIRVAVRRGRVHADAVAADAFDALAAVRRQLEPDGWRVAVAGARIDAWPSGMQRDMGEGLLVHLHLDGAPRSARTFDPAPAEQVASVDDQWAAMRAWAAARSRRGGEEG